MSATPCTKKRALKISACSWTSFTKKVRRLLLSQRPQKGKSCFLAFTFATECCALIMLAMR